MAVREILILGDEKLYRLSQAIEPQMLDKAKQVVNDLNDTIDAFKARYGYGRAIAAPQIDEPYRIVYMKYEDKVTAFINPSIEPLGEDTYTLWDDCMSFPGLEVYVRRYKKIEVTYQDLELKQHVVQFEGDLSELFQHEYDHLDGILAVQRGVDNKAFRINKEKIGKF
jgi:peptide deformylase